MNVDVIFEGRPLDAGRYLDALIAEQVFGVRFDPHDPTPVDVPHYSTDMGAAWGIVETLAGDSIQFRYEIVKGARPYVYAKFVECGPPAYVIGGGGATSAPLAICRAALKVKHGQV